MIVKHVPLRKCIVCQKRKPKSELAAMIRPPKNSAQTPFKVLPGIAKKQGRGAYICKSEECFKKALKLKKFEKVFRKKISGELYTELEKAVKAYE